MTNLSDHSCEDAACLLYGTVTKRYGGIHIAGDAVQHIIASSTVNNFNNLLMSATFDSPILPLNQ